MNGWVIAALALTGWIVLAVSLALLLGRAIRSNTRTPNPPTPGPHTPTWARQKNRRRQ